jgi:hypothetical protein
VAIDRGYGWSVDFASIDPTFNAIRPRGVVLQRDLPKLMGMGAWPDTIISPFMHELAHHWCFRGTVGNVLAALNLRSSETAVFGSDEGPELHQALRDHLTFRAVLEFLRPLCEGMALFAEFDTVPGRSRVISDPQKFAWIACATGPVSTERELSAMVRPVLRRIRVSRDGISRKANVLTHPQGDVGRAYFEGYLMVKSLHRQMMLRVPQAADPDWFLCYLRDYIFSDPGLVVSLLEEPEGGKTCYEVFIQRFYNRMWEILRITSEDARRYTKYANSGLEKGGSWSQIHEGLNFGAADGAAAGTLVDGLLSWMAKPSTDAGRVAWRNKIIELLGRRDVAFAAVEEIPINIVNGRVEVRFDGPDGAIAYQTMPALDATMPNRRFLGWAAVILKLNESPVTAIALGDDKQVIALQTRPDKAVEDPKIRSILTDPLSIPPFLGNVVSITIEAHQLLREFAERAIFHGRVSKTAEHARTAGSNLARVFIDMMSEDWRYLWDAPPDPDFGRGRPVDLFESSGAWPLFAPLTSELNAYIRASIRGPNSTSRWRAVKVHAEGVERRFGIRLIERMSGKTRFWM